MWDYLSSRSINFITGAKATGFLHHRHNQPSRLKRQPVRLFITATAFYRYSPFLPPSLAHTRIEVVESVISGTTEALLQGEADLAIAGRAPPGFLRVSLIQIRFVLVARPDHALHKLERKITLQDMRAHR